VIKKVSLYVVVRYQLSLRGIHLMVNKLHSYMIMERVCVFIRSPLTSNAP